MAHVISVAPGAFASPYRNCACGLYISGRGFVESAMMDVGHDADDRDPVIVAAHERAHGESHVAHERGHSRSSAELRRSPVAEVDMTPAYGLLLWLQRSSTEPFPELP